MTQQLYLEDAYCFENDAIIQGVQDSILILDRTCMYPGGGGQPADVGFVMLQSGKSLKVESATKKKQDRQIKHMCVKDDEISSSLIGTKCTVKLDEERRQGLMRHHTALHVFNTVMLRSFNGWITGVVIGTEGSHIDFKVDNYSEDMRTKLSQDINQVLAKSLAVKAYYISEQEFQNSPRLLRTLEAMPPIEEGRIRVVEIEGFEAQACGGTHVRNTNEVGSLLIRKVKSKGRQNRRFYVELTLN